MRNNGPDFERNYLNGNMSPDNPEFKRMHAMYKDTPEGKVLEEYRKENAEREDGLESKNYSQMQQIIRDEFIPYNGKPDDRISMVRAIRRYRDGVLKEQMENMTDEELQQFQIHRNANKAKVEAKQFEKRAEEDKAPNQQKMDRADEIKMRREKFLSARDNQNKIRSINQYNQAVEVNKRQGKPLPPVPEGLKPGADGYIVTNGK